MIYYILVRRSTGIIDAISVNLSFIDKAIGYRFVSAEEAERAKDPYDLYPVPFARVYERNVDVGHKLGYALPAKKYRVPIFHAAWPASEAA